jgi:hypothetical protein
MGSCRRLLLAGAVLLAAATAVPAAGADASDDARAFADRFVSALLAGDVETVCGMLSPKAEARLGGADRCRRAFGDDTSAADRAAQLTLVRAAMAAERSASRRNGQYVTKKFGLKKLAREIEFLEPDLTVVLGKGPDSAAGRLPTTVVLDTRSSARRLVVYAESDDGSIWRVIVAQQGGGRLEEVGQGVPEASTPPKPSEPEITYTVDSVAMGSDGRVIVSVTLVEVADGERETYALAVVLVPAGTSYLVDDLLYSAFSE